MPPDADNRSNYAQPIVGNITPHQWEDFFTHTRRILAHEAIVHMNTTPYGRTIAWDRTNLYARNLKSTSDSVYGACVQRIEDYHDELISNGEPPDDAILLLWDLINLQLEKNDRLGRHKKPTFQLDLTPDPRPTTTAPDDEDEDETDDDTTEATTP